MRTTLVQPSGPLPPKITISKVAPLQHEEDTPRQGPVGTATSDLLASPSGSDQVDGAGATDANIENVASVSKDCDKYVCIPLLSVLHLPTNVERADADRHPTGGRPTATLPPPRRR